MAKNFVQSSLLRNIYYSVNRTVARSQIWRDGSPIFINSLPKSGTHLITSLFDATQDIKNAGRHLRTVDFDLGSNKDAFILDVEKFEREISKVHGNQYFSAHFPWDDNFEKVIRENGLRALNIIRDPRDMIVSRFHYVMGLKRHHLNAYLTSHYSNDEERILALINGPPVDNVEERVADFIPYSKVLERFAGWQATESALTIRYEDILGPKGYGSVESQIRAISQVLGHVGLKFGRDEILDLVPKFLGVNTATMRTGKAGEWTSSLSIKAQQVVNRELSTIISQMGYSIESG